MHMSKKAQKWLADNIPFWDKLWPPYSPDANLLDYTFWVHVESKACTLSQHWDMSREYICNGCKMRFGLVSVSAHASASSCFPAFMQQTDRQTDRHMHSTFFPTQQSEECISAGIYKDDCQSADRTKMLVVFNCLQDAFIHCNHT